MAYRSRIRSRIREKAYKNILISIGAGVLLLILVIFFGLQALVKLSVFLGGLKSAHEIPSSSKSEFILPPTLDPLPEATNSAIMQVSGISQPGLTIEVFLNNTYKANTLVDNDSQFKLSSLRLEKGENVIKLRAKSSTKEGNFSLETKIIFENTPPALEIKEPANGWVIKKTAEVRIIGKTEADTSVFINDFLSIVDSDGNFSYLLPLVAGENTIKIVARDRAGNQTANELKVIFEP